jgi:serine-type D-Ala-D-Ala carboxypeptidase (penicillin-binding protein 5/6)
LARAAAALAALLCLWPTARAAEGAPADAYPRAARAYLVAIDGEEVWAPLPPASLTKLMTALLALEAGEDAGAWVEVSRRAARETGSRAGLRAGEALTVDGALTATLVSSANDACLALAEHLAGSVPAFVERMNARAAALGLTATHFRNPCGHDAPGHVSSARDLLRLTRAALAFPEFRRLVALTGANVATRGGRALALRTHNLLLGRLQGAVGVKSGYTESAGRCMVALAVRDGVEVLAVLLDSPDRWWTTAALLELAFDEAHKRG